jgi:hypothetical protein
MEETKLTRKQQKTLWVYFQLLAETFNESGLDMKVVLKPSIDIQWTKQSVHDYLWCPIQEAYIKEHSTTKLGRKDIDKIYDFLHKHLSEKFGAITEFPEFPSIENLINSDKPASAPAERR